MYYDEANLSRKVAWAAMTFALLTFENFPELSQNRPILKMYAQEDPMKIKIKIGSLSMDAELNETPTAQKVAEALPIKSSFNTWGDEIYFSIPVKAGLEPGAKAVVELGDIGYWPQGAAFCIFFGQTPMSSPGEIVPASPVNVIGKVIGDPKKFKEVMREKQVIIEAG